LDWRSAGGSTIVTLDELPLNHLKARYFMFTGRLAESDDRENLIAGIVAAANMSTTPPPDSPKS